MQAARLSSKFQICIPKEIREQLHLKSGQQFIFIPKGNGLYMIPKLDIEEVKGIMEGSNTENIRDRSDRI